MLSGDEKLKLFDKIITQLCKEGSSFSVNGSYAVKLILKSVGKDYRKLKDIDINVNAISIDRNFIINELTPIIKNINENYDILIDEKNNKKDDTLKIRIVNSENQSNIIKIDFKAINDTIEIDIVNGYKIQRITKEIAIAKKIISITDPKFIKKNGRYKDIDEVNYLLKNVDFCMDAIYNYIFKKDKIDQLKPLKFSEEDLNEIDIYLNDDTESLRNILNLSKTTDITIINNLIKELLEPMFAKYIWYSRIERSLPKEDYDMCQKQIEWEKQQKKNKQNDKQTTNKQNTTKQDTKQKSSKNKDDEIEFS